MNTNSPVLRSTGQVSIESMRNFSFLRLLALKVLFVGGLTVLALVPGCQNSASPIAVKKPSADSANVVPNLSNTPAANVFVDEVMLAKPYAFIGGTVQNVSSDRLEKLSIDIELRRRDDDSLVKREINIEPSDLAPGEKGKFSLKVLSEEWSGSRVLGLRSGKEQEIVAFKSLPGAKRPPEKLPEGKVINVKTPRRRSSSDGEEFLNTPDTPVKVP